jgi:hypothetical protein
MIRFISRLPPYFSNGKPVISVCSRSPVRSPQGAVNLNKNVKLSSSIPGSCVLEQNSFFNHIADSAPSSYDLIYC